MFSVFQLVKKSLVSKRYWNLIRTHRHKLALLDVDYIYMYDYAANQDPAVIEMFNKVLSPEEYNELIVRNGYSEHISLDGRIAGKKYKGNDRNIYEFWASAFQNTNNRHDISRPVFFADVELKDETWPLFQHFIRLLMDPFIYIRYLLLSPQKEVLSLFAGAMNPDHNRVHCDHMNIDFNDDTKEFIVWIKDHMRCNEILLDGYSVSNYDEELLDIFLTAAPCTSAIHVKNYDLSEVIVDLVQKFMGLKSREEYQVVESIQGKVDGRRIVDELKRNFAEFIAEEKQYEVVIIQQ